MTSPRGQFRGTRGPGGTGHRNPALAIPCAACGSGAQRVTDSRPDTEGNRHRTYTCLNCGARTKTLEIPTKTEPKAKVTALHQLRMRFLAEAKLEDLLDEIRRRVERT